MLDIGLTEILIIAVVALFVLGPKDIPKALRTVGVWVGKLRSLSREFQTTVEDAVRDTELDEVKKQIESAKTGFEKDIKESVDPEGEISESLKNIDESGDNFKKNKSKIASTWPLPLSENNKKEEQMSTSKDSQIDQNEVETNKSEDTTKS